MTRTEPDTTFAAAARMELERSVRERRQAEMAATRAADAPPVRDRLRRDRFVGAITSIAVLVLTAIVTIGLLQIPHRSAVRGTAPPVQVPCATPERLAPLGCGTYTAIAAREGRMTRTWAGSTPATLTVRVLNGRVTALIGTGCSGLTVPIAVSKTHLTVNGRPGTTAKLCLGAKGEQEHWMVRFFNRAVGYTRTGPILHLTSGTKTLDLTEAPAPKPTVQATRDTAPKPPGSGCPATAATMPAGAITARVGDVDGDGRAGVEWAKEHYGTVTFGVSTASHATFSAFEDFAGGGDRSVFVAKLNDRIVAVASEGRSADLFTVVRCRMVATSKTTTGKRFFFYGDAITGGNFGPPVGTGTSCVRGHLYAVKLAQSEGSAARVIRTALTISADGRVVAEGTPTVINRTPDSAQVRQALRLTCGSTEVLRPTH